MHPPGSEGGLGAEHLVEAPHGNAVHAAFEVGDDLAGALRRARLDVVAAALAFLVLHGTRERPRTASRRESSSWHQGIFT